MKNQLISVGLLSLVLAGCNMTDFRLPTVGEDNSNSTATTKTASSSQSNIVSNPLIEEMCAAAKKNEARANELYRGREVSAQGEFGMIKVSGKYYPYVDFKTQNFNVTLYMNEKTEPWKQYDDGQIVSSGNVKVSKVSVKSWGGLNGFDHCSISN
ncbi:MAG: hypothetical protein II847_03465 [Ruminobacter sp.]|uniref:hypothetical protein n=1 Tax=Ruminobacter sp. TaxID=2774296 RepID=UPI00257F51E2|nr:hypothetical protein [Ruminobacter sp.]MBQ3641623.1 hypothetical protein [bacterium]MBQ3775172.1 hypothetical protein [Ruminobacter sp.]